MMISRNFFLNAIEYLSWITKSNSFRRSAKEKSTDMTAIEEQLQQKLQDVKSS